MFKPLALSAALASAGILSISTAALAQQDTSAKTATSKGEIQEVTVTAQKRVQSSSKVAASLSVVSGDDLKDKGVSSVVNLTELIPNTNIGKAFDGSVQITIRGISSSDNTEKGDPAAALHIDGVYIGRPAAAGATFYDLERVEVLRGPQGTLYGRNANAGAINLISRKPGNKFEGSIDAEVGDYNTRKLDAMVNVPVNDTVALRAVVSSQKHDGYSHSANATNGFKRNQDDLDSLSARVLASVKLSPSTTLLAGVDTASFKGAGPAIFEIVNDQMPTSRVRTPQIEGSIDNRSDGAFVELKTNLGAVDLTYLYGYHKFSRNEAMNLGGNAPSMYGQATQTTDQNSHELRLSSANAGPLQWVGGLYWYKEVGHNIDFDVLLPAAFGGGRAIHFVQNPAVSKSRAAFGQITYSLTPASRVILGARTTSDKKSRDGQTRVGAGDTPIGVVGNKAAGSWSKATYRAGYEQDIATGQMAYATVSNGYKAGGFNDGNSVVGDPNYNAALYYKPESIVAYEAGLKGRFMDNKLQLGASVFLYDYADLQKSTVVNNQSVTGNAAKAKVSGVELEGRVAVGDNGRVNFAVGSLSAKYDTYVAPNGQSLAGQSLDSAPKANLVLGYTHNWDLDGGARVSAYLGTKWTSSYILSDSGSQTAAPRTFTQGSTTKTDLTVTYQAASDKWSVQAYAKNLEDKSTAGSLFAFAGGYYVGLSEPRTVGLRGNVKF